MRTSLHVPLIGGHVGYGAAPMPGTRRPPMAKPSPAGFSAEERRRLLMQNSMGERLVCVLEAAGFRTLEQLCRRGAAGVLDDVARNTGSTAWQGRGPRLARVLAELAGAQSAD